MKRWLLLAVTAALVTAAVVTAVAAAGGTDGPSAWADRGVQAVRSATGDDSLPGRGDDALRECGEDAFRAGPAFDALEDPEARAEAGALRERHRAEMHEWWESYGDDPRSDAAQGALETLRERHREQLRALFEANGVELPDGVRLGSGGHAHGMFGAEGDGVCGSGRDGGMMGGAPWSQ